MNADIYNENGILFVNIDENFDIGSISNLKDQILESIETQKYNRIILDLTRVRFLDSTAIGIIIKIALNSKEKKARFALINLDENIYKLFTMSNLQRVVQIFSDKKQAIQFMNE